MLAGKVVGIISTPAEHALVMHIPASPDDARIVLDWQSRLSDSNKHPVIFSDLQRGDSVTAVGVPSPDKALVYHGQRIVDNDLSLVESQLGFVVRRNLDTRTFLVRLAGGDAETVRVSGITRFVGKASNGSRLHGLRPNEMLLLTGVVDRRTSRMVRAIEIRTYG